MANSALYNRFLNSSLFHGGAKKTKSLSNLISLINDKKGFLLLVFANLILQLGITYYTFMKTPATKVTTMQRFGLIILLFMMIFVLVFPMPSWIKFPLFCFFSVLQGLFLSMLKTHIDQSMIQLALSGTMSIFVFLFTFALVLMGFGVYLSNAFGIFLFWALLLLILFEVISLFAGTMTIMRKGVAFIGLLIFSLYVLYDTHTILQRNYFGDFITASLDYYLDILNIFLDVLTLNNN